MARFQSLPTSPGFDYYDPYDSETLRDVSILESEARQPTGLWEFWLTPGYIAHFLAILTMIVWPWVFFVNVLRTPGGLPMPTGIANLVQKYPEDTTYIITAISSILSLIMGYSLSTSVTTLAIKLIASTGTNIFSLSFVSAFKSPSSTFNWVWSSRSWFLQRPGRWPYAALGLLYFIMFLLVTSAFNVLLTPQTITRSAILSGTELDFASNDPDCTNWYYTNLIPDDCNWISYNDYDFTTCLGNNQMVDVLESGRNNILSLISNNTDSVTFTQLGGLHFLGPIRGVLPIGPNGVSAFNSLSRSPLSDGTIESAMSYNYTLDLQGLASDIVCTYAAQTPIVFVDNTVTARVYNGTCPEGLSVLDLPYPPFSPPTYLVPAVPALSNTSLSFWACNSPSTGPGSSYDLYFRGDGEYLETIGNVTCTVSAARPALIPVTYRADRDFFTTGNTSSLSPNTSNEFISQAVRGLGQLVWNAQALQFNSVAESIITLGVKNFGLRPMNGSDGYLRLMEAMIQGVLEYQATYVRLLYSSYNVPSDPGAASCMRDITGSMTYNVIGWRVTAKTAAFLGPLTIVNLTSLIILLVAALGVGERGKLPRFDPTNTVSLLVAASRGHLIFPRNTDRDPAEPQVLDMQVRYVMLGDVYALQSVEHYAGK